MPNERVGSFTYLADVVCSPKSPVPFRLKSANGQSYQLRFLGLKMPLTPIFAYRNFGSISPINLTLPRHSSAQNTSTTTTQTSSNNINHIQTSKVYLTTQVGNLSFKLQNSKSISILLYSFTHSRLCHHIPNTFQAIHEIAQNPLLSIILPKHQNLQRTF